MNANPPNARFWVYLHGPVKLTLRPGQRLSHYWGVPTEEGWISEAHTWEYDADDRGVRLEWGNDGRDCDGRLTQYGECWLPLALVRAGAADTDDPSIVYPDWQECRRGQRDEYAEAAGY